MGRPDARRTKKPQSPRFWGDRINDPAVDAVAAPLKEFGFRQPIFTIGCNRCIVASLHPPHLQCIAVHCNAMKCIACNVLQFCNDAMKHHEEHVKLREPAGHHTATRAGDRPQRLGVIFLDKMAADS
jgi:hypothetical protein